MPAVFPPDLHDGRHLKLKAILLLVWALVSFGVCFFARDLQWMVAGWPLGYWVASQGAVLVFMAIVLVYAVAMSHFERQDALAAEAARNYSNVHTDVDALLELGLIERLDDGRVQVPFDAIEIRVLAAAAA